MRFNARYVGLFAAGLCSLSLMAAPSNADQTPQPVEPTIPPTYEDVASIIANNCQICHTGGEEAVAGISLDTEEEVVARAAQAFAALDIGLMPYGDPEFRTTPDGIKLLGYLKSQIPLEPAPLPTPAPTPPANGPAN
ncbi:MAG TPA: hypothetical protein VE954_17860 [Oligoflexus sp.]|uniref:hypothetical protein n=1 Tax=Oligoflexus sp. TaxID=1971216 RepID=UPI002D524C4A|nr:hypothetical protein [Oligoflexus sp.]HYX34965.1 hypothetical protein [Oligoflexus sp.]